MTIIVTVGVIVERADGTRTETSERRTYPGGDNPRMEAAEVDKALQTAIRELSLRVENGTPL